MSTAYLLPILTRLFTPPAGVFAKKKGIRCLLVVPTRDLGEQIEGVIKKVTDGLVHRPTTYLIDHHYAPEATQRADIERLVPTILIGTPKRVAAILLPTLTQDRKREQWEQQREDEEEWDDDDDDYKPVKPRGRTSLSIQPSAPSKSHSAPSTSSSSSPSSSPTAIHPLLTTLEVLIYDELDRLLKPLPRHTHRKMLEKRARHPVVGESLLRKMRECNPLVQFIGVSATVNAILKTSLHQNGFANVMPPIIREQAHQKLLPLTSRSSSHAQEEDFQTLPVPTHIKHYFTVCPTRKEYKRGLFNQPVDLATVKTKPSGRLDETTGKWVPKELDENTLRLPEVKRSVTDKYKGFLMLYREMQPQLCLLVIEESEKIDSVRDISDEVCPAVESIHISPDSYFFFFLFLFSFLSDY